MFTRSAASVIPGTGRPWREKNYDHGVLHRKEIYRARHSFKR
jgi:hypothetical protein